MSSHSRVRSEARPIADENPGTRFRVGDPYTSPANRAAGDFGNSATQAAPGSQVSSGDRSARGVNE